MPNKRGGLYNHFPPQSFCFDCHTAQNSCVIATQLSKHSRIQNRIIVASWKRERRRKPFPFSTRLSEKAGETVRNERNKNRAKTSSQPFARTKSRERERQCYQGDVDGASAAIITGHEEAREEEFPNEIRAGENEISNSRTRARMMFRRAALTRLESSARERENRAWCNGMKCETRAAILIAAHGFFLSLARTYL